MLTYSRAVSLALLLGFLSCQHDDDVPPMNSGAEGRAHGSVQILLTDAPAEVNKVVVTIEGVSLRHCDESGWQTIPIESVELDLLQLRGGVTAAISDSVSVPLGTYCELRLLVGGSGWVEERDGSIFDLKTPSANSSGIKIKGEMAVVPSLSAKIVVDFDAEKSLTKTGNGKYVLNPSLRLSEVYYTPDGGEPTPGEYLGEYQEFTVYPDAEHDEDLFSGRARLEFPIGSVSEETTFVATLWQSYSNKVLSPVLHMAPHYTFLAQPTVTFKVTGSGPSRGIIWDGEWLSTNYSTDGVADYASAAVSHFSDGAEADKNGWSAETCHRGADTQIRRTIVANANASIANPSPDSTMNGAGDTWLTDVDGGDGDAMREVIVGFPDVGMMTAALSETAYSSVTREKIVNRAFELMSQSPAPAIPLTDQETLDFFAMRQQCLEWAVRLGRDAGAPTVSYDSPAVTDPKLFRPGMGLFRTDRVHAAVITDIDWESDAPTQYRLVESNMGGGWTNPIGQEPWSRTVSERVISEAQRVADGYKVIRYDDDPVDPLDCTVDESPIVQEQPLCSDNFSDVRPSHWWYEFVTVLACAEIVSGYDGTDRFGPEDEITRAQLLKMVVLTAIGEEPTTTATPPFSDVEGHWGYPYIAWAHENEVITGYEDDTFRPDNPIKRAEAAQILMKVGRLDGAAQGYKDIENAADHIVPPVDNEFLDIEWSSCATSPVPCWYYDSVYALRAEGVMCGYANGDFGWDDGLTRAQGAKIVCLASGMCSARTCD